MLIRPVQAADAPAICSIYNYYIRETCITFEETELSPREMEARIEAVGKTYPYLVCEKKRELLGYCYASRFRDRSAYRFAAEMTIYLKRGCEGQGLGSALYGELIEKLAGIKLHALVSAITLPNAASVALHEKFGFKKAAHFHEVGYKLNTWLDVGYWERLLP